MWYPANLGPVLLSHESILSLSRLGLISVFPSSKVPSFSNYYYARLIKDIK